MSTSASRSAARGWCVIAGFVVAHNVTAAGRGDEMLSQAVDRWLATHPVLTRLAVAAVALHLVNALPPVVDPLAHVMDRLPRWT